MRLYLTPAQVSAQSVQGTVRYNILAKLTRRSLYNVKACQHDIQGPADADN